MSVQVESLTKIYGTQAAVNHIDFELKSGEILGFLGPNGAGKSTTMKMITGYLAPTSGRATVCGVDVLSDPISAKRHIGYLPEHNPLYLDMYVTEYLRFVAKLNRVVRVKQRVEEMIEKTGLGPERHKLIGSLSKGYRQRVGLAQAMLHDPSVLILDEPTSGLDPNQLEDIRSLIRELGREKAVILSTHIMQEVQLLCDRVIIIHRGKLVADAKTEDLATLYQSRVKLNVSFQHPVASALLNKLSGVVSVRSTNGLDFELEAENDNVRKGIFYFAVEHNNPLLNMYSEQLSIEDVFKKLTKS